MLPAHTVVKQGLGQPYLFNYEQNFSSLLAARILCTGHRLEPIALRVGPDGPERTRSLAGSSAVSCPRAPSHRPLDKTLFLRVPTTGVPRP